MSSSLTNVRHATEAFLEVFRRYEVSTRSTAHTRPFLSAELLTRHPFHKWEDFRKVARVGVGDEKWWKCICMEKRVEGDEINIQ